jgi:glutathione S-transferase
MNVSKFSVVCSSHRPIMSLTIYGHPVSQPTRAVLWALAIKSVAHDFQFRDPLQGDGDKPEYLAEFPSGLFPGMADGDLRLTEGAAILVYLAETRGWDDLLPKDPATRAKVHQWLHWHHSNSRVATGSFMRPLAMGAFGIMPKEKIPAVFAAGKAEFHTSLLVMSATLSKQKFLAGDAVTLADLLVYCEFDQLESLGVLGAAGIADFPDVMAWIARMKEVPSHDAVRVQLNGMSGMVKPTADAFLAGEFNTKAE